MVSTLGALEDKQNSNPIGSFWSQYNMRSDLTIFVPWLDLWVKVDVLGERGRGSAGRWQAICSMPGARRIG